MLDGIGDCSKAGNEGLEGPPLAFVKLPTMVKLAEKNLPGAPRPESLDYGTIAAIGLVERLERSKGEDTLEKRLVKKDAVLQRMHDRVKGKDKTLPPLLAGTTSHVSMESGAKQTSSASVAAR